MTTLDQSAHKLIDTTSSPQPTKHRSLFSAIGGIFKFAIITLTLITIVTGGFLIGGFLKFADAVSSYSIAKSPPKSAAIVVFTGGISRISEAVKLLESGRGTRLLISGVHSKTSINTLKSKFHIDQRLLDCCIDIDKMASDTISNAAETKKWTTSHNFESLILVTSNYHMPRSMLETKRLLPNTILIPHAVVAADFNSTNWHKDRGSLRLLLSEYSKYVATQIRPLVSKNTMNTIRSSLTSL